MSKIILRTATKEDASKLLAIYAYYIEKTVVTFDYTPPTLSEFEEKIEKVKRKYPFLAAEREGEILGYTYASPYKEREAYDWTVETTIYLAPQWRGKGLGRLLYETLEKCLQKQNVINLEACIADTSRKNDPNLSKASPDFHHKMGYKKVAHFENCGYKFGRWYDVIWMEKVLEKHPEKPKDFIPFSDFEDFYLIVNGADQAL